MRKVMISCLVSVLALGYAKPPNEVRTSATTVLENGCSVQLTLKHQRYKGKAPVLKGTQYLLGKREIHGTSGDVPDYLVQEATLTFCGDPFRLDQSVLHGCCIVNIIKGKLHFGTVELLPQVAGKSVLVRVWAGDGAAGYQLYEVLTPDGSRDVFVDDELQNLISTQYLLSAADRSTTVKASLLSQRNGSSAIQVEWNGYILPYRIAVQGKLVNAKLILSNTGTAAMLRIDEDAYWLLFPNAGPILYQRNDKREHTAQTN